jgi:hypothetical protein
MSRRTPPKSIAKPQPKKPSQTMLFGLGVGVVTVVSTAIWLRGVLNPPPPAACGEGFAVVAQFPQDTKTAKPLSVRDLQGALNYDEWGLVENATLERPGSGPHKLVLDVRLPQGMTGVEHRTEKKGGVSFAWQPAVQGGFAQACLGYSVRLPADFRFNNGGKLPGLFGGEVDADGPARFALPFMWREHGRGEIAAHLPGMADEEERRLEKGAFTLARGRWVKIEQEIRLNTPGSADGVLRVWIDGELKINRTAMRFRNNRNERIKGVQADIHYAGLKMAEPTQDDTTIRFSPFELRWQ